MTYDVVYLCVLATVVAVAVLWNLLPLLHWCRLEVETRRAMECQIKDWYFWQTEVLKREKGLPR